MADKKMIGKNKDIQLLDPLEDQPTTEPEFDAMSEFVYGQNHPGNQTLHRGWGAARIPFRKGGLVKKKRKKGY